ncbi:unnamed protein product [Rotaria socialis]|uniref:Uncharacterized protein n=1 Tax=Rotaria socialis TaxID=392032 RepID=A0A818UTT5_9BILA|nr:unnamed protein product [Rotaria socialis]
MSKSNYSYHSSSSRSPSRSYYLSSHHSPLRHSLCSSQTSHQPHEKHLTFHINSSDYEAAFVNNETSTNTINKLLNHMKIFKQYSIDTESERANNQLSLIQINSITITPPSLVMLFELEQLPDRNSQKYENILQLFQIIFRTNNKIYSWEKMQIELEPVKEFLVLPIPAMLIDIQPHFSMWYSWARTQCGVQSLSHRNDKINDNEIIQQHNQHPSCDCHPSSPYKINKVWSLQNSLNHWSSSLTSSHSSLSRVDRINMIHYATHDVIAATLLIRPITERWAFEKLKIIKMNEMFIALNSIKLPPLPTSKNKKIKNINTQKLNTILRCNDPDVEDISWDDEIYLNQLVKPNDIDYIPVNNRLLKDNELVVNNHYMIDDVNDKEETAPTTIRKSSPSKKS